MNHSLTSYDFALSYAHAFRVLFQKHMESRSTGNYADFSLIVPLMSIGGFACELFLKSLLGEKCKSHRIYSDLYKRLEPDIAQEIETVVIHAMRIKKGKPNYNSSEFIADFKIQDRVFEEFRYPYEPMERKTYNVDFTEVLIAALQVICELKFGTRPIQQEQ